MTYYSPNQNPMQQEVQQLSSNHMIQQALQTATSGMSTMPSGNMMQNTMVGTAPNVMVGIGSNNMQQQVSHHHSHIIAQTLLFQYISIGWSNGLAETVHSYVIDIDRDEELIYSI